MSYRSLPWRWLGWVPVALVFNQEYYTFKIITGRSMKPTLNPDTSPWRDILAFDRTVVHTGYHLERGDIVAFRSPTEPDKILVKRILALGGDEVKTLHPHPDPVVRVPEGYMWVEGDEGFHTRDSNYFGPASFLRFAFEIPQSLIDSKSTFIVWPPARFGPIHTPSIRALNRAPKHSAAWKLERNAFARQAWRRGRVQIPDTNR